MTREEFKKLWEANDNGSGITYDDIANYAKEWGLFNNPRLYDINVVTYEVLKAAKCNDAEEFNNNKTTGAHMTPLMEERVKTARDYAQMCTDDIEPRIHAQDFELGAIFGGNQMKQAIVQWLCNNVEDCVTHIDINKLLYEVQ